MFVFFWFKERGNIWERGILCYNICFFILTVLQCLTLTFLWYILIYYTQLQLINIVCEVNLCVTGFHTAYYPRHFPVSMSKFSLNSARIQIPYICHIKMGLAGWFMTAGIATARLKLLRSAQNYFKNCRNQIHRLFDQLCTFIIKVKWFEKLELYVTACNAILREEILHYSNNAMYE